MDEFKTADFQEDKIEQVIKYVSLALEEKGYDPIKQIVGYLMSGDPGYISSYKDARKIITDYDRTKILDVLVKNFLK